LRGLSVRADLLIRDNQKANKNGHRNGDRFVWLPLLDSNQLTRPARWMFRVAAEAAT